MTKTFVLDTSVLLYDPEAIDAFEDNDVVVPITVLEELDAFKSNQGEIGSAARRVYRRIDELRGLGSLADGVPLGNGRGSFSVAADNVTFNFKHLANDQHSYILGVSRLFSEHKHGPVIIVSKDVSLRVKADAIGVTAQDYTNGRVDSSGVGAIQTVTLDSDTINAFYATPGFSIKADDLVENDCAIGTGFDSGSVLLRVRDGQIQRVKPRAQVSGITSRNAEQCFLFDLLLDDRLDMVIVNGVAGSGKTLLSLAAALQWCGHERSDRRILITKAIESVGQDIGYLPGTKDEKMREWTKPFFDNLEILLDKTYVALYLERGIIELDALTYIRGRSIMNRFVIIDETQNLAPKHLKTIVSRISDSSKLILLGDLQQIDNPYLDASNCGLAYVMRQMRGAPNVGMLSMRKSERGRLAELAVERL